MRKAISNRKLYPALAAGILLALASGAALKVIHASFQDEQPVEATVPADDASITGEASVTDGASATQEPLIPFESGPFVQAAPSFRLADPALLRSTSPQARADTVVAGRSDPFAPIVRPTAVPSRPQPTPAEVTALPTPASPAQVLPVVPVTSTRGLPPLPSLPTPMVPGTLPQMGQEVAVAPTATPVIQNPVDQIAVTGVAQIGNTVSVIVRESGSGSSRHVKQGDLLAGGQVRVKSIDTSAAEPVVVLTYNGQDFTRTVGSAALIGSL
jgi:hypothetical protein